MSHSHFLAQNPAPKAVAAQVIAGKGSSEERLAVASFVSGALSSVLQAEEIDRYGFSSSETLAVAVAAAASEAPGDLPKESQPLRSLLLLAARLYGPQREDWGEEERQHKRHKGGEGMGEEETSSLWRQGLQRLGGAEGGVIPSDKGYGDVLRALMCSKAEDIPRRWGVALSLRGGEAARGIVPLLQAHLISGPRVLFGSDGIRYTVRAKEMLCRVAG